MKILDLLEAQDWQGNKGNTQAQHTDHTMDEAIAFLKANYPFSASYTVTRAEPGFRVGYIDKDSNLIKSKGGDEALIKSMAHGHAVDDIIEKLQMQKVGEYSGSEQATHSIGWSWHTYTKPQEGFGLLYYEDRGMGSDQIKLFAKTKPQLLALRQEFINAGILKSPGEIKARQDAKAAHRKAVVNQDKLQVGGDYYFYDDKVKILGFTKGHNVKIQKEDGSTENVNPMWITDKSATQQQIEEIQKKGFKSGMDIKFKIKSNLPWTNGKIVAVDLKNGKVKVKDEHEGSFWKGHEFDLFASQVNRLVRK